MSPAPGWSVPRVFAHRCGGALAPENTLAGLRISAALGFRAVEFDVMLSAEGSPWVIHDETLERTTDGRGPVCRSSNAALSRLDAGASHHRAFAGEPLPAFAAVAAACRALGLLVNVEIKPASGFDAETGELKPVNLSRAKSSICGRERLCTWFHLFPKYLCQRRGGSHRSCHWPAFTNRPLPIGWSGFRRCKPTVCIAPPMA